MTHSFRRLIFRPQLSPSEGVPLGARSVGHYRVAPGFFEPPQKKHFVQVYWSVEGTGTLGLRDGATISLPPGFAGFYLPGDVHAVENRGEIPWEYRWWTMDGPMAPELVAAFGLRPGLSLNAGPIPVALFDKLRKAIRDVTRRGEATAAAVAYELLGLVALTPDSGGRRAEASDTAKRFEQQVMEVLHRDWNSPTFGVDQLAASMKLHRSLLARKFRSAFGMAPSEYLMRWRVQNALTLLQETEIPIAEVGRRCGWEDANYFARLLRKQIGMTPSEFRLR